MGLNCSIMGTPATLSSRRCSLGGSTTTSAIAVYRGGDQPDDADQGASPAAMMISLHRRRRSADELTQMALCLVSIASCPPLDTIVRSQPPVFRRTISRNGGCLKTEYDPNQKIGWRMMK
jgi:hypothetical protein